MSKKQIEYWVESSKEKHKTMNSLYKAKRYADCLFFGYLVLEKILKALVVKKTKEHPPYTHNLLRLTTLAKLNLSSDEIKFLSQVNEFNMQARYPDEKLDFYKICTKKFTDKYYIKIKELYTHICQQVKQKK